MGGVAMTCQSSELETNTTLLLLHFNNLLLKRLNLMQNLANIVSFSAELNPLLTVVEYI